ncbi:NAD/NADP-dependent octopine/nopaline dehydrogenase family protein [Rhodoplanes azumiensis]|uniref:NAD/NADP octopine/nopaline dehydrogenase family protein n=1 Tax=Rhodoplanes azumiensis TaxID=1897628 RepID=A0ABW5AER5_9BRAD
MSITSIAVLGAGHGGFAAAADLGHRGFSVRLHARNPERLAPIRAQGGIQARGIVEGLVPVDLLTCDVAEAVRGADLIMLVVPSVAHETYAQALAPLLDGSQPVFVNPGHTGGGLHFVHELRRAGCRGPVKTCETVTLTYITRLEGPTTVNIYSYTKRLRFAALPGRDRGELFALMKPLYPEIVEASSVLETALANINAVFHSPGMIMNAGWIQRTGGNFLFYREGITDAVGRVTAAVDAERMAVAKALGVPAVSFLQLFHDAGLTTTEARDSGDISRACIESAPNKTIKAPGTLDHRYVHEDVGYGLVPMAALGRVAGVPTPTMDALIQLAGLSLGIDYWRDGLTLEKLGLAGKSAAELLALVETGT